jgi:hypothetical protein
VGRPGRQCGGRQMTVPPGYQTWREVIRRAYESGGGVEAGSDRLLWFLVKGELQAWRSDAYGNLEKIPVQYWTEDEGQSLLKWRPELSRKQWLPIVKLADLQKCLPTEFEQMMENSARIKERQQRARHAGSPPITETACIEGQTIDVEKPPSPSLETTMATGGRIQKAIMSVYECAKQQGTAIPGNRDMPKFVNEVLRRDNLRAKPNRIMNIATSLRNNPGALDEAYRRLLLQPGETPRLKNIKHSSTLRV